MLEKLSQKRMTQFVVALFLFAICFNLSNASEVNDIREQIEEKNDVVEQLEEEIREYEQEVQKIGQEAQTLSSAVKKLDISEKKISTDIRVTENRIDKTNLSIDQLAIEIEDKEIRAQRNGAVVAQAIRDIVAVDSNSMIETLLMYDNLANFWDEIKTLDQFQESVKQKTEELREVKKDLIVTKNLKEKEKGNLLSLKGNLADQKQVITYNKNEKDKLLKETQNKESNYKILLQQKINQREAFLQELQDLEAALQRAIDPDKIPESGTRVFRWPFDTNNFNPTGIISQLFGGTQFAKNNPHVYGRPFHNGVDFAFPTGTPIKAALGGEVVGFGNTDLIPGCYSYGKWVLIEHNNGLSTLYAHLSVISVSKGQSVDTGDIIGYNGNTGYSTGPHLHFTVYASEGVEIVRLGDVKAITNCANAYIPVAPHEAYLDPMSYLQ